MRPLLRRARRQQRRLGYRLRQRSDPVTVGRDDLLAAFRATGLREGDGVYLQSAMSRFGRIEGGPATVVGALEEVVGPEGLIAMPAFPIVGGAQEYLAGEPVFDLLRTPSRMGAISEHFRTTPGTLRSLHPTHSICARGPRAETIVAGHEHADTPFGHGTPFPRLIERGVRALAFGTGVHVFTFFHTFEDVRPGGFPLEVYLDRRYTVRCVNSEGVEHDVRTRVHDPALAAVRIDNHAALERRFQGLLLDGGLLRAERLGRGEILAITAPDLMEELERLLREGVTIYDIELPA